MLIEVEIFEQCHCSVKYKSKLPLDYFNTFTTSEPKIKSIKRSQVDLTGWLFILQLKSVSNLYCWLWRLIMRMLLWDHNNSVIAWSAWSPTKETHWRSFSKSAVSPVSISCCRSSQCWGWVRPTCLEGSQCWLVTERQSRKYAWKCNQNHQILKLNWAGFTPTRHDNTIINCRNGKFFPLPLYIICFNLSRWACVCVCAREY